MDNYGDATVKIRYIIGGGGDFIRIGTVFNQCFITNKINDCGKTFRHFPGFKRSPIMNQVSALVFGRYCYMIYVHLDSVS